MQHPETMTTDPELERRIERIMQRPYREVIRGDAADGFLIEVPDLPGCMTAGETEAEAVALLPEAMAAWLESALAHGDPISEPAADPPEPGGRVLLRMPRSLHRRLNERATEEGVSANQLAVSILAGGLGFGQPRGGASRR